MVLILYISMWFTLYFLHVFSVILTSQKIIKSCLSCPFSHVHVYIEEEDRQLSIALD